MPDAVIAILWVAGVLVAAAVLVGLGWLAVNAIIGQGPTPPTSRRDNENV